jgi:hypothetical protein
MADVDEMRKKTLQEVANKRELIIQALEAGDVYLPIDILVGTVTPDLVEQWFRQAFIVPTQLKTAEETVRKAFLRQYEVDPLIEDLIDADIEFNIGFFLDRSVGVYLKILTK